MTLLFRRILNEIKRFLRILNEIKRLLSHCAWGTITQGESWSMYQKTLDEPFLMTRCWKRQRFFVQASYGIKRSLWR